MKPHLEKYTSFTESEAGVYNIQATRPQRQDRAGSKIALKSEDVLSRGIAYSFKKMKCISLSGLNWSLFQEDHKMYKRLFKNHCKYGC